MNWREWLRRVVHWGAGGEEVMEDEDERFFRSLHRFGLALSSIKRVLRARDVGGLEVPQSELPSEPPVGSLDWFMRVSHSVSRMDLYPEVREALIAQLTTRRRPTAPSQHR